MLLLGRTFDSKGQGKVATNKDSTLEFTSYFLSFKGFFPCLPMIKAWTEDDYYLILKIENVTRNEANTLQH
jgi:hypothetical protein